MKISLIVKYEHQSIIYNSYHSKLLKQIKLKSQLDINQTPIYHTKISVIQQTSIKHHLYGSTTSKVHELRYEI